MKKLFLLPMTLGDINPEIVLPSIYFEIINEIECYITENIRTARRFLLKCNIKKTIDEIRFLSIDKHSNFENIITEISAFNYKNFGLLSEAGVPCVADPGSNIVLWAHYHGFKIIPITGPSSILLALMASGLNGQNFVFHGYLPVKKNERIRKIKQIERESQQKHQSQIFIETPYRNNSLLNDILEHCNPETFLCIATNLTLKNEYIITRKIKEWKNIKIDLNKQPSVYILQLM